jgi:hypothetical protein
MNLKYKLFGKPQNLKEFIEKVRKTYIDYVEVEIEENPKWRKERGTHSCSLVLRGKKIEFRVATVEGPISRKMFLNRATECGVRLKALERAIKIAEELKNYGIEVEIKVLAISPVKKGETSWPVPRIMTISQAKEEVEKWREFAFEMQEKFYTPPIF